MEREINSNKKIAIGLFALFTFFIIQFYPIAETASAASATDSVVVTLDVTPGISISNGTSDLVTMAPNIGVASNSSIGSSYWTVKTNATNGYTLAVKADASPALVSGVNSFADYHAGTTPAAWVVNSGNKEFGYSAYGIGTDTGIWGTVASCGSAGIPDPAQNYAGFTTINNPITTGTITDLIAHPSGVTTTICFAAAQNGIFAPSGTYTATITATAITL